MIIQVERITETMAEDSGCRRVVEEHRETQLIKRVKHRIGWEALRWRGRMAGILLS